MTSRRRSVQRSATARALASEPREGQRAWCAPGRSVPRGPFSPPRGLDLVRPEAWSGPPGSEKPTCFDRESFILGGRVLALRGKRPLLQHVVASSVCRVTEGGSGRWTCPASSWRGARGHACGQRIARLTAAPPGSGTRPSRDSCRPIGGTERLPSRTLGSRPSRRSAPSRGPRSPST